MRSTAEGGRESQTQRSILTSLLTKVQKPSMYSILKLTNNPCRVPCKQPYKEPCSNYKAFWRFDVLQDFEVKTRRHCIELYSRMVPGSNKSVQA